MANQSKKNQQSRDSQREDLSRLYSVVSDVIPRGVLLAKNKKRQWTYGYDEKYDIVIISKDGTVGEIYNINGINVALPLCTGEVYSRSKSKEEQYWEPSEYSSELANVKSIFHWHSMPKDFKAKWVDYIEKEFVRREDGMFFMNNGVPTYITGSHYMYLQWTRIDVGHPDLERLTGYSLYSGRRVKPTTGALEWST